MRTPITSWVPRPAPREIPLPVGLEPAPWVPVPLDLLNFQDIEFDVLHQLVVASFVPPVAHPLEPLARWMRRLFPFLA